MKRFFIILAMMIGISISSFAETQWYTTKTVAIAAVNQYTGRYVWSDWQKCVIKISFDLDNDIITVFSNKTQYYTVYDVTNAYTDSDGGTQVKFFVIDADGDRGYVRLRVERNGTSQIYIDFSDVAWVYGNVTRIA